MNQPLSINQPQQTPATGDEAFPIVFVVVPAFVGALLWLITMLNNLVHL